MTRTVQQNSGVEGTAKATRRVPKAARCPYCRRTFWSPKGWVVCPWCGKRIEVLTGIEGSMAGFFTKLLEGIAISGGISQIEVSHPHPRPSQRSQGLVDACRKVISETPHQKRHAEAQNREKEVQGETNSPQESQRGERRAWQTG